MDLNFINQLQNTACNGFGEVCTVIGVAGGVVVGFGVGLVRI